MGIIRSDSRTPRILPARRQRGFTLIEVLIAALVLAIGLLGLASLQAVSMNFNHGAMLRTQATNLAYEITDAMRANVVQAKAGAYNINFGETKTGSGQAIDDLSEWGAHLAAVLPSGQGRIQVDANGNATVTVRWDSSHDPENRDASGTVTTEFAFQTRL